MNLIQTLHKQKLIHPPDWLPLNVHYLTYMGMLLNCLEQHYGNLPIPKIEAAEQALADIKAVLAQYGF